MATSHSTRTRHIFAIQPVCEFDDDDKLGKLKYTSWKSHTRTTAKLISAATASLNVHQPVASTANTNDYFWKTILHDFHRRNNSQRSSRKPGYLHQA